MIDQLVVTKLIAVYTSHRQLVNKNDQLQTNNDNYRYIKPRKSHDQCCNSIP